MNLSAVNNEIWAWQRTSSPRGCQEAQKLTRRENVEESLKCYMCGLKDDNFYTTLENLDQHTIKPRKNKCNLKCKFHMLKNPWSGHVTPLENYNPVWTEISYCQPFTKDVPRDLDIKAVHDQQVKRSSRSAANINVPALHGGIREFNQACENDLHLLDKNCKQELKKGPSTPFAGSPRDSCRATLKSSRPSSAQASLQAHTFKLDLGQCEKRGDMRSRKNKEYCFACEKALVYKLFTQTLKIKRDVEEARHRSKDTWVKYNLRARKGTSPVHAYWPTKTWDADHWPVLPAQKTREKLELCDRSVKVLGSGSKKQVVRCDIDIFTRC